MKAEIVTFEHVFDLHHRRTKEGQFTQFSFVAQGKTHYAVLVPGWPQIGVGMTVTVLLQAPGDWRVLRGWLNHQTGECVSPTCDTEFIFSVVYAAICVLALLPGLGANVGELAVSVPWLTSATSLLFGAMSLSLWQRGLQNRRVAAMIDFLHQHAGPEGGALVLDFGNI